MLKVNNIFVSSETLINARVSLYDVKILIFGYFKENHFLCLRITSKTKHRSMFGFASKINEIDEKFKIY